ncbi:MAG: N-acetylmuramoyl-L-alanine amidase [Chlamydiota bacterium]
MTIFSRYFPHLIFLFFLLTLPLEAKPLIVLDPGHGGFAIGAHVGCIEEKKLTLETANEVQKLLKKKGYRVVMTRTNDVFVSLGKRTKVANQTKCNLFVSIHYNGHHNPGVNGIEVFYYKKGSKQRSARSKKAAGKVLKALLEKTSGYSRGIKHGNFHVIRETSMPAILVEGGFVTHVKEREQLAQETYLKRIAEAIVAGIEAYFSS